MQTTRAPLALFVRALVVVQMLLSLPGPVMPASASPAQPEILSSPPLAATKLPQTPLRLGARTQAAASHVLAALGPSRRTNLAVVPPETEPAPLAAAAAAQGGQPAQVSIVVEPAQLQPGQTTTVLVYVTDAEGRAVGDGSRISLQASGGRLEAVTAETREGFVRLALTAGPPGPGRVTAQAGQASGEATFTVGQPAGASMGRQTKLPLDMRAAVQRVRNRLQPAAAGQWKVENERYAATWNADGFDLTLGENDALVRAAGPAADEVRLSFRLSQVQAGSQVLYRREGRAAEPQVAGNEAHYQRMPGLVESYQARDDGVQQIFTLETSPAAEGDLVIRGDLETLLQPELISSEEGLIFHLPGTDRKFYEGDGGVLRYTGALVRDATGRQTYASLALQGRSLDLTVPGQWLAEAEYPVVIDPMIGSPNLVSDPRDMQGELDVAYNPDNNEYLVVWGGYDTGGASADLEGQRVAADGTLVGGLITIAQAAGDQKLPAVTYNPDAGEYLVLWTDYRNDPDGDVYGQRVAASGSLVGSNLTVGATEALQDTPDVAYNPADHLYLAVWRDRRGPAIYIYGQVISSSGVLSGTNLAIYNETGDNQQPRVAYNNSTNEFMVVWSRWSTDIYGKRLSGTGTLLDNPGTAENEADPAKAFIISNAADDQYYPAVTADPNRGTYLVVWTDERSDSRGDIYGQVIGAGGVLSGTALTLSAITSTYQRWPDVAYDPATQAYLAVWRDYRSGNSDVYGQIIAPAGVLSGTNVAVEEEGWIEYPRLAANTAGGGYLAAWGDWRTASINVYGRPVAGSGATEGDPFPIGPVTGLKQYPWAVFNEATREYLLVWEDYRNGNADVYAQRLSEAGQMVGGNFRISDAAAGGDQLRPQVAAAGASGYLVAWEDRRNDSQGDIYGQQVLTDGVLAGNNLVVAATSAGQSYPAMAYNPDDDLYLAVWRDKRVDGYGDIYGQVITASGALSGSNFIVSAYGSRTQSSPSVAYNKAAGQFLVAWRHYQGSNNYDIYGQQVSRLGALLDNPGTPANEADPAISFQITTNGLDQEYPQVAVDPTSGNSLVVWYDERNYSSSNYDIYGQVIAPTGVLSGSNLALTTAANEQRAPVVASLAGGQGFLVTWHDYRSGSGDIYGQQVGAAGDLKGSNQMLAQAVGWIAGSAMAGHPNTAEALVVWEESYEIYAQRYSVLVADLSATPWLGSAPLTVQFTNLSAPTAEITGSVWSFGDGYTQTLASPLSPLATITHTYSQPGVYTVTLAVSGPAGSNTQVRPAYITVNSPFSPTSDLRGYWRLDEQSGLRQDQSGYDYHLTPMGGMGWAETGYIGSAADLASSKSSYLVLSNTLQSGLGISGSLTLMGWVRPRSSGGNYMMLAAKYQCYDQGQQENVGYRLGLDESNRLNWVASPDGTYYNGYELAGATPLGTGAWRHVAAVFDAQAKQMRVYVDGALDGSKSVSFSQLHVSSAPFMLGADLDASGNPIQYFDGLLDEWRVYARALSQAEIAQVMQLPGASFVAAPPLGFAPLMVTLTNQVVGPVTTARWDYGDGIISSTLALTHTHLYAQPGVYTVTLQASDGNITDTTTHLIRVMTEPVFWDDLDPVKESWTHSAALGVDDWSLSTAYSRSPSHTYYCSEPTTPKDDSLQTREFVVPPVALLSFWHTYQLESRYDGAVIEISADGGATFTDLESRIITGSYTGQIVSGTGNVIGGRFAWTGGSIGAMSQVVVDLSAYAGASAIVRFRLTSDSGTGGAGWYIDDVVVAGTQTAPQTIGPAGGTLSFDNDRLHIEFPPDALTQTAQIEYLLAMTQPITPGGVGLALAFELTAEAVGSGEPITQFLKSLTLTLNVTGLLDLSAQTITDTDELTDTGVLTPTARPYLVYTTQDNLGEWTEIPLRARPYQGLLVANVDHFSDYQAGATTQAPGVWSFVSNLPHSDLFSGAASFQIPLNVPAGRNGLQPQLTLSYNSRRMDGRTGNELSVNTDTGPIADGWALDVMDISRDRWFPNEQWDPWEGCDTYRESGKSFSDIFTLMVNGASYELYGDGTFRQKYGRYYAKDAPWLYIWRHNAEEGAVYSSTLNVTGEYWVVRLPDGTEARLGYTSNSEQAVEAGCHTGASRCRPRPEGYGGRDSSRAARRWRVDQMTDPFGNTVAFEYDEYQEGSDEIRSTLRTITYNTGLSKISLAGVRGRNPKIDTIVISNTNSAGVMQTVRWYKLAPGQLAKSFSKKCEMDPYLYTTLASVQEFSGNGQALPPQTFTYQLFSSWGGSCDAPLPRLVEAKNGYGATTNMVYEWDGNSEAPRNYRVLGLGSQSGEGSSGPAISSTYQYDQACYDRWIDDGNGHNTNACVSRSTLFAGGPSYYNPDPPKGPLVGHSIVTQTQRGPSGEVLATSVHRFYTDQSWRVGREWQTRQLDRLGALLQKQDTQWMSTTFGSSPTFFVYAGAVTTTQDGKVNWTSYEYNPTQQGGAQYGNVTAEYHHGEAGVSGDERTIQRVYYPLTTTGWIVNKLARETVYPGLHTDNNQDIASCTCYQYDDRAFGLSPIKGAATTASRWKGAPGSSACSSSEGFVATRTGYDTWGNPVVVTDALGRAARTAYDSQYHLFPIVITDAMMNSVRYDYDRARGLLLTATDPNSATTHYGYDAFGRLASVTKPYDIEASPTLSYTYADGPAPWKIETRQRGAGTDTLDSVQYYDGLGRLLQTRSEVEVGQQVATRVVYDALGRKQIEYAPRLENYSSSYNSTGWENLPHTTLQYDALGRTAVITAPDGTTTRTGYWGWTTTITDANGHRRDSIADAHGRLVAVQEYSGTAVYTTTYGYDTLGNLTRVTDTLGHTTVITFDALGRKTAMNDPDMGVWSYEYDAAGNLITQTDALGRQLVFGYDALNRVTGKWSVESGAWKELARYGYDQGANGIGRRTAMTDVTGMATWAYDARGRVLAETRSITAGLGVYATGFAYDSADRVTTMTYPDGEVVRSGYNPAGLPYTLTSSLGDTYVSGATYDAAGQVTRMNLGYGGLVANYGYDAQMHRLMAIQTRVGQSSILSLTYGYDLVGNVKAITDTTNSGQVQRFDYDPLDRLTRGYTAGGGQGTYDESYTYDAIGNLLSKGPTGAPAAYAYTDTAHIHAVTRLSGGPNGGSHFEYDKDGNMTRRVEFSGTQVMTYHQQFNAENRLTVVTATNGITYSVTRFAYDGDGARVLQIAEAGTTIYIGDHYEEFLPGVSISNLLSLSLSPAFAWSGKAPGMASLRRVAALPGKSVESPRVTGGRTLALPPPQPATLAYPIVFDDTDLSAWSYVGSWTEISGGQVGGSYHKSYGTRSNSAVLIVPQWMNGVSILFGPFPGQAQCPGDHPMAENYEYKITIDGAVVWHSWYYPTEVTLDVTPGVTHTVQVDPYYEECESGSPRKYYSDLTIDAASFRSADTTPPATTASTACTLGAGGWCKSNATVTLTATDSSGVKATYYKLDSASWLTYSVPYGVAGDAQHAVEYYSIDHVYNQENPHPSAVVKIDTVAPTTTSSITCTWGAAGWCLSDASVQLSAWDGTSGVTTTHYRVDSGNWNTGAGPTVAFTVTGELTHTVAYYAQDKAGQLEITRTRAITIDTMAPTTAISVTCAQIGDWCLSTPVTVTLTAVDSASGVAATYYQVGEGSLLTYTNPLVFGPGSRQVRYYSRDNAGHEGISLTRNIQVDPGSMTRIDPSPPDPTNSAINLTWVASQTIPAVRFATLWVSRTASSWASTGMTRTVGAAFVYTPSSDGRHCFATVGTDEAWQSEAAPTGNGDGCTTYDHTAPTITSLNVPARTSSGFAVTWSAQDNLTGISHYDVQYKSDSGAWTDWLTNTLATQGNFIGPGGHAYTFRVRATDGAGNASGWQTSGPVTVLQVKKYYTFGGRRVAMRAEGVVYFLHADHLGSTSLVTTGAGAEVARQFYLPYGAPRWISGTLPTDFTYTGQQNVSQINLLFYQARFYSSSLGRFLSADTIVPSPGNPQSLNRYSYGLNNPVKYQDPSGHIPVLALTIGAGAIIGGIVMGGTYALTTKNFDTGQFLTVVGAGGVAGGLIGSGVGIAAGMTAWTGAAAIAAGTTIAAAGAGAAAGGEGYMLSRPLSELATNGRTGDFDTADFGAAYIAGSISGAVSTKVSPTASGAIGGAAQSALSDVFHHRNVSVEKATAGAMIGGATGFLAGLARPIGPQMRSAWQPTGEIMEFGWTQAGRTALDRLDPQVVSRDVASDLSGQFAQSGARSAVMGIAADTYQDWYERRYGK